MPAAREAAGTVTVTAQNVLGVSPLQGVRETLL